MKLILFTGSWCIPCQQLKPIVKDVAEERGIELNIIDVETETVTANAYMVRGVPMLILLDDIGVEINRASGAMGKEQVIDFLEK